MPPSAIEVVVADSGPLMALGRVGQLALLSRLFVQVHVPKAVLAECTARPQFDDARKIAAAVESGALLVCDATPIAAPGLQLGERAAIGFALEIGAVLLADDRAARICAAGLGLTVIGTLGVLVRSKRVGALKAVRPIIDSLRTGGHRLSDAVVAEALAAAGE